MFVWLIDGINETEKESLCKYNIWESSIIRVVQDYYWKQPISSTFPATKICLQKRKPAVLVN